MNRGAIVLLLLILLSLFAGKMEMTYGAIPQKEREALIALFNSTNGDNWEDNSGWKEPPLHTDGFAMPGTENRWYGITCDEDNKTVLQIYLWHFQLTGTIPRELGNLSNLQYLNLQSNRLNGTIPSELGNLSNLYSLDLSANQLSGSIPPELGQLSKLQWLFLCNNQLTGYIPAELGNLSALRMLALGSNQLIGSIPSELGNSSALNWLNLSSNQLTGPIPAELLKISNLWFLNLAYNQLTGPILPGLGKFSNLSSLDLNSNQLTGPIPPELGNLSALTNISLNDNQLTGTIPPELGHLSALNNISLNDNQLTGTIPTDLGNLSNLLYLDLSVNQLTGTIPMELGNLSKLEQLHLNSNQLTGSIPPELGILSNLQSLNLSSNQLRGLIPPELGNLSNLEKLFLNSNQLVGKIPQELKKLENLQDDFCDFRWNGLYTDNNSLRVFLNNAQIGGKWESTQTIAPVNVTAWANTATSVQVLWLPITYTGDEGRYSVLYSLTPGGPYTFLGATGAKYDYRLEVTGLNPTTKYYFVVRTRTNPHEHNKNLVESEYSAEASAETMNTARLISGKVSTITGKGIEGVTVMYSPSNSFTVTDSNGNYRHAVDIGWSGTVEPTKTGYFFEPRTKFFENVTSDQLGTDFRAMLICLVISGNVTSAGEGIAGVTLTFKAEDGEPETVLTKADGSYSHEVPYGWIGKVTPSKSDLLFDPPFTDYVFPGLTEKRDRQDYRLGALLTLNAIWKQDNALIIRKNYGEIELNVTLLGSAITASQRFSIYRKESGGSFQLNKELVVQEQKNSFQFVYRDEYLEKDKSYTYIARALDANGKVIGESKERTITWER